MAIQMRRGAKANYDATKMLAGEIAIFTDTDEMVFKGTNSVQVTTNTSKTTAITAANCVNIADTSAINASIVQTGNFCILKLIAGVKPQTGGSGWVKILDLPVLPSTRFNAIIMNDTDGVASECRVDDTGFYIYAPIASKSYWGSVAYII